MSYSSMSYSSGFQLGMKFCSYLFHHQKSLPKPVADLQGLVSFQLGFLFAIETSRILSDLFLPSPADQDCTPDGGVSANCADDNSIGGVTTPEVTWRASGFHSHGGANE